MMYDDPYGNGGIAPNDIIYRDFGVSMDDAADWGDEEYSDEPLPAGTYKMLIQQGDWKTTNTGKQSVYIRLVVVDGPFKGRAIFDNFWLWAGNPKSQKAKLKTIRRAVGADVSVCGNLGDLLNREVMCKVLLKDKSPDYGGGNGEKENSVSRYFKVSGSAQAQSAQPAPKFAPQPQQPAQPQQGGFPTYNQNQQQAPQNQNVQPSEQQPQGSPF